MSQNWESLIDELYKMGGVANYPYQTLPDTDDENLVYRSNKNISRRCGLSAKKTENEFQKLSSLGLVILDETKMEYSGDGFGKYRVIRQVKLTKNGFELAHDRKQDKRSRDVNRTVALLTLVLGLVGIAQATALTAQTTGVGLQVSAAVTTVAGIFLLVIYIILLYLGYIDPFLMDNLWNN